MQYYDSVSKNPSKISNSLCLLVRNLRVEHNVGPLLGPFRQGSYVCFFSSIPAVLKLQYHQAIKSMEEEAKQVVIDEDLKKKIKETVKRILKRSSLCEITEIKAREEASTELDLDLSRDPYKLIVREAVDSFIEKAITTIESEMGKLHTQIVEDVEGVSEKTTTTAKKKKKKKKKKKEEETLAA